MPVATSQVIIHQHHVHSYCYYCYYNCVSFVFYSPNVFKNNNSFPFITSVVVVVCTIGILTIASFTIISILTCILHKNLLRIVHRTYNLNINDTNIRSSNVLLLPTFKPITSNLNSSSNTKGQ
jgi:hypothetical protein